MNRFLPDGLIGELVGHQPQAVEIYTVIGGTEEFGDAIAIREVNPLVQHHSPFCRKIRPPKGLPESHEVPSLHQENIGVVDIHLLQMDTLHRLGEDRIEDFQGFRGKMVGVSQLQQNGLLCHELDGIAIPRLFLMPIPAEVATGFAYGIVVLH